MRKSIIASLFCVVTSFACMPAPAATSAQRVVALGGDITETIYALDAADSLVGVDSTSLWPVQAHTLPDVGYVRQLSAEGVLALHPQLIIATHDAGPVTAIVQLRSAGVRMEMLPSSRTPADVVAKVRTIGHLLGREALAEQLAGKIEQSYAALADRVAKMPRHPRVVFLMSAGAGSPMAAGSDTAADRAMALAGGVNAVEGYTGYKPISAEALVALAPQAIVLMRERNEDIGGVEGVMKMPGVAQTPAGQSHQIIFVDGEALLGFGPRSADEALALQKIFAALSS